MSESETARSGCEYRSWEICKDSAGQHRHGRNVSSSAAQALDQQWAAVDMHARAGGETGGQADSRREAAGRSRGCRGAGPGTDTGVSCVKQMQMFAQPWWAMAMATSKTEAKAKATPRATPAQRVRSGQAQLFKVEKLQRGQRDRHKRCSCAPCNPCTLPHLSSFSVAAALWQLQQLSGCGTLI